MKNKELYIGLGALAVIGLGIYFSVKARKSAENKSDEDSSEFAGGLRTAGASIPAPAAPPAPSPVGGLRTAGASIPSPSTPPVGGSPSVAPVVGGGGSHSGGTGRFGRGGRNRHWGWRNNFIVPYGYPVYVGLNDLCYYIDAFGNYQTFYCNNWMYDNVDVANIPVSARYSNVNTTSKNSITCKKGKCVAKRADGSEFCSTDACSKYKN